MSASGGMVAPGRILVVEDDPAAARLLEIDLAGELGEDIAVAIVETLADALAALAEEGWAVCVLDLGLPDSQGLDTLRAVAGVAGAVPVLVLSGDSRQETAIEALRLGAEDFIDKHAAPGILIARKVGHVVARQVLANQLRASRDGLQAVLDNAADGIATIDQRGIVQSFNHAAESIFGWTSAEVIGRNVSMLMPADLAARHDGFLARYIASGEARIMGRGREVPGMRKDGSVFPLHLAVSEVTVEGRRLFTGILSDLSGLKAAERQADERGRLVEAILHGTPDPIFAKDTEGRYLLVNDACCEVLGLPVGQIIGRRDDQLPHAAEAPEISASDRQVLADGGVVTVEESIPTSGGRRTYSVTKGPLLGEGGAIAGLIGVARDITELRRAQSAVAEAADLLRLSIGALKDAFVLFDPDERMVVCNEAYEQLIGVPLAPGTPFVDVLRAGFANGVFRDVADEDAWLARRLAEFREGGTCEMQVRDRWFLVTDMPLPSGHVVGMRVDVTALREARVAAEAANRAKSEFLSRMSHELRTPLNAILGFAELMESSRKEPPSDRQRGYLNHIRTGGAHLLNLINDVLDLARIEAGRIGLSIEPVDTRTLVDDCLTATRPLAGPQQVVLRDATLGMALPWLSVDLTRAKQVLLNLLSNAVKYNRPGGTVTLGAALHGPLLRLSVGDTGWGIPAERQAELFQPFSRLGRENGEIEGTGIGLTITRRLVEDMGGDIGFHSAEGEGSTFWVDLPLAAEPHSGAVSGEAGRGGARGDAGESGRLLLYVEDNPANLALMEEIIDEVGGFVLSSAQTGEEGVALAQANPPDVILMDINLPGMDGFEALAVLKADARTRVIPVIALSADAMPDTVQRGIEAGFAAYLTKPVRVDALVEALERASERAPERASGREEMA